MDEQTVIVAANAQGEIGCPLIQAILGGTISGDALAQVPWTVSLEGMRLYRIRESDLPLLAPK